MSKRISAPTIGDLSKDEDTKKFSSDQQERETMHQERNPIDPHAAPEVLLEYDTAVRSSGSPVTHEGGALLNTEVILEEPGHHDDAGEGVTMFSHAQTAHGSLGHRGDRKSRVMSKRSDSRRVTQLTFDVVVELERDPSFVADLHDLTKEKIYARDVRTSVASDVTKEGAKQTPNRTKKIMKHTLPWRQHGKSPSKAGLLDEKMRDRKNFGVKLRKKRWVPTIVNPLEIDLRKSQMKELKEVFEIMEDPKAGMVSIDDIGAVVGACGSQPTPALINNIVEKIKPANPGYLTSEEFEEILGWRLLEQDPIEEIERAFKNMSRCQKNRVGLEDLREVSKLVDYPLTDDELMDMINAACPTGCGTEKEATLGGFVRLMTSPNWYDTPKTTKQKKEKMTVLKKDKVYRQVASPLNK